MPKLYVKLKVYPFMHLHNTTPYTVFCNTIFLKSAKLTKKHLKIMECVARNHLNIRNTHSFKALTSNFFLSLY